jgi:hypothetical protein
MEIEWRGKEEERNGTREIISGTPVGASHESPLQKIITKKARSNLDRSHPELVEG